MAYIVNRFSGETDLPVTGTELKTFWSPFQINVDSFATVAYSHSLESHGDLDAPDGYVDLVNTIMYPQETMIADPTKTVTILRSTRADRRIVDVRTTTRKKFLAVRFKFNHAGNCRSIHEVFSGSGDSISMSFGNTDATLFILDETFNVTDYARFLVSLNPLGSESKELTLELYATNTEYPVLGARCFAEISANIIAGANTFTVTKQCSLNYKQRWQYEARIETLG